MSWEVREVQSVDRDSWERLFLAYGEFYNTSFDESVLEGVFGWLLDPEHPVSCHVAVVDGDIAGIMHLSKEWDTFTAGPLFFLDDLYTAPEYRGRGVAQALISQAREIADGHSGAKLRWITDQDNQVARRLYDRLAKQTHWVTYEIPGASA